jgi:hypothetical protein
VRKLPIINWKRIVAFLAISIGELGSLWLELDGRTARKASDRQDFVTTAGYYDRLLMCQRALHGAAEARGADQSVVAARHAAGVGKTLSALGMVYVRSQQPLKAHELWSEALLMAEASGDNQTARHLRENLQRLTM